MITVEHLAAHVWWWRFLPDIWRIRSVITGYDDMHEARAAGLAIIKARRWTLPVPFPVAYNFCVLSTLADSLEAYLHHWFNLELAARASQDRTWEPACKKPLPAPAFFGRHSFKTYNADITMRDLDLIDDFIRWVKRERKGLPRDKFVRDGRRKSSLLPYLEKGLMHETMGQRGFLFNDIETLDRITYLNGSGTNEDSRKNAIRRLKRSLPKDGRP